MNEYKYLTYDISENNVEYHKTLDEAKKYLLGELSYDGELNLDNEGIIAKITHKSEYTKIADRKDFCQKTEYSECDEECELNPETCGKKIWDYSTNYEDIYDININEVDNV